MKHTITIDPADLLERALLVLQDGILIVEKDSTIVYVNSYARDMMERFTGRSPVIGDNLLDFVSDKRRHSNVEFISRAFSKIPSSFTADYSTSDEKKWFEISYYPMINEMGEVDYVCIKSKDLTETVLLERKLKQERKERKNKIIKATIEAQEKERSLIGRELHDNVNQVLTTVKLYTELCYYDEVPNKELLKRSVQQVNYCIEEIRSLSKRLAVPKIDELSFEELIKDLIDTINNTKKTSIKLVTYGLKSKGYTNELRTTIYRIIQEQLTNVIKYAHASSVKVTVAATNEDIAVEVQDNGVGFDMNEKKKGNGIINMMSRAESVGGNLRFDTSPGRGCTMIAEFPLH
jgi:PAS domain S-box-containing protein